MDKKLETKRLWIYLILSFGLTWIIFFSFIGTGFKWDGSNPYMESFIGLGMLIPFVAHILSRLITKEGLPMTGKDSLMLGISFKDRKWKYYLFALLIPWVYFEIMCLMALVLVPDAFDSNVIMELGYGNEIAFASPILTMVSSTILSFLALGEEGGWRGYMMPKLIKLLGIPKAIITGGIIWGLWHAPLTVVGHNFGTDYPGFPFAGIIIMCIQCTLMGVMLTYITIKTESIWPAAIMHAVNNGNPSILKFFLNEEVFEKRFPGPFVSYGLLMIPMLVIDIIIIVRAIRRSKGVYYYG